MRQRSSRTPSKMMVAAWVEGLGKRLRRGIAAGEVREMSDEAIAVYAHMLLGAHHHLDHLMATLRPYPGHGVVVDHYVSLLRAGLAADGAEGRGAKGKSHDRVRFELPLMIFLRTALGCSDSAGPEHGPAAQRLRHGRKGEWETARWQDSNQPIKGVPAGMAFVGCSDRALASHAARPPAMT